MLPVSITEGYTGKTPTQNHAKAVAAKIGVDKYYAEVLPEAQRVSIVGGGKVLQSLRPDHDTLGTVRREEPWGHASRVGLDEAAGDAGERRLSASVVPDKPCPSLRQGDRDA